MKILKITDKRLDQ